MLSTISRQVLRATSTRRLQSVGSLRYYASDNHNEDSSSSGSNNNNTNGKSEGAEALMSILSSSSSSASQPDRANAGNVLKGNSAALILETLTKATDRQQQASRPSNLLNSKSPLGGSSGGRHFLSESQTCTHNLHIHASMNNTIITLTDSNGDPITTQSGGSAGFKKSARSGPEAGYQAMTKLIEKVDEKNVQIQTLHVLMKGFGPGRDSAFKAIRAKTNWDIKRISDTTPIPFNGCRPPKQRRL
ncbi:hypothetical protein BC939DRAFT_417196 [Gamsiella multidivaricata]|uniref:uncharacterized protein n=1 Tax=Gamsiella multidivaricata TaxID=101098 RepID=UPI002221181F|nr:uncharacterized protein BC939DRAFT_417196 [Gamsiella multidivaricata]KAG0364422.1 hypothetical protein BGZ54_007544 [Gamsiella multidivaricata]KAI7816388.1 hypothetical protein BC939DRAFT_417196 [Gamsiella multidivaricata]